MTPLIPEVHQQLMAAAGRRARPPHGRHVPRRAGALALAGLLLGGSAMAATSWHPQLGDDDRGHPTAAIEGVPAEQVEALNVLRREQTEVDRGRRVEGALRLLTPNATGGVHTDGVRLLSRRAGSALVLIPVQRAGPHDPAHPSWIRRDVLCLMHYRAAGGGGTCGTTSDLRRGRIAISVSDGPSSPIKTGPDGFTAPGAQNPMRYYQLVPDGVSRVEVTLRDDTVHVVDVRDNAIELSLPGVSFVGNVRTRWLDSSGQEVAK